MVNIIRKDGSDNRIGSGSGFIFDANGTILTNAHVVGEYSDNMRPPPATRALLVTLQDGRQYDGTVVSADSLGCVHRRHLGRGCVLADGRSRRA